MIGYGSFLDGIFMGDRMIYKFDKGRDLFFDFVKFFAIFLVILGHVIGKGSIGNTTGITNFIVGMNMPIFFAISGYFASSTLATGDGARFFRHIRSYFWPFAVVSVIFSVLAIPFGLSTLQGAPVYALKRFLFAGWFIWVLGLVYGIVFGSCFFAKKISCKKSFVVSSVLLLIFLIPECIWHFGGVRCMIPFFLIGAFVFTRIHLWEYAWVGIPSFILYVGMCFLVPDFNTSGLSFYVSHTSVWAFVDNPIYILHFVERIIIGSIGIVGTMFVIKKVCKVSCVCNTLAPFGTTTLGVYILHQWMLDRLADYGLFPLPFYLILLLSILLFVFCHYLTSWTLNNVVLRKWVWGKR